AAAAKPKEAAKPAEQKPAKPEPETKGAEPRAEAPAKEAAPLAPSVRKLVEENRLDPAAIPASGKDGRLTKGDVLEHMRQGEAKAPEPRREPPRPAAPAARGIGEERREERVRMSRLRRRIAERLKEAQDTAAMLTTFNEVDMTNVMA